MSEKSGSREDGQVSDSSCTIMPACADSVTNDSYNFTAAELIELDSETAEKVVQSAIVQESDKADETLNMSSDSSDSGFKPSWQRCETLRLIRLYKEHQGFFEDQRYKKKAVWAMLTAKLTQSSGKSKQKYTAMQAYNRWKNLTKIYRDNIRLLEETGYLSSKSEYMYFHELDAIFGMSSKVSATRVVGRSARRNSVSSQQSVQQRKPGVSANISCMDKAPEMLQVGVTSSGTSPKMLSAGVSSSGTSAKMLSVGVTSSGYFPKMLPVGGTPSAPSTPIAVIDENMLPLSDCEQTSVREVVNAVSNLYRDQERTDLWKLERLEQMHKEKMQAFAQFLDILNELA